MSTNDLLSPEEVLEQVAQALPEKLRENVIIIGSLAAGYYFFAADGNAGIRTKDVDCMLSPHVSAVSAAAEVTHRLRSCAWTQREDARFGSAGDASVPDEKLPMVRLHPPTGTQWFLELMSAPPPYVHRGPMKQFERITTAEGDYAICSFGYLGLVEWEPLKTSTGIKIARPEMMALANMLHHPRISDQLIDGTNDKRSNKDLGRVLALAHLTISRDRARGTELFEEWPKSMYAALNDKFAEHAGDLAAHAGSGIAQLLSSPQDLNQALAIANRGLLACLDIDLAAIAATGRRLQADVLDRLAKYGELWRH